MKNKLVSRYVPKLCPQDRLGPGEFRKRAYEAVKTAGLFPNPIFTI
jgi:hypothetical protein